MDNLVSIKNNQVVVSSRQVAENFGKRNVEVLDKIREILSVENSTNEFFKETTYSYNGRMLPEYLMNRDGFTLLAMGFTGEKALQWKIKYINAFNEMEQQLKNPPVPQYALTRKTYKGVPVMTTADLAYLAGVTYGAAAHQLKAQKLAYVYLDKAELRNYKAENKQYSFMANDLIIVAKDSVIKLLAFYKVYAGKVKEKVEEKVEEVKSNRELNCNHKNRLKYLRQ